MACQIRRNKETGEIEEVLAPNGKPSILYEHIKRNIPANYTPDRYVRAAFERRKIRDLKSRDEIALALWSKVHIPNAAPARAGRQLSGASTRVGPELNDRNGEPIFPIARDAYNLFGDAQLGISKRIGVGALIRFLQGEKLIYKDDDRYVLSKEATLSYKGTKAEEENLSRIKAMLEWFDLPKDVLSIKRSDGDTVVGFHEDRMPLVRDEGKVVSSEGKVVSGGKQTNTERLVRFLSERFPQLEIGFVTEEQARALHRELQLQLPANRRNNIDFANIKSFVYKGKVHLIEGRVDNEVIAEEVLHPFVYTVYKQNAKLFGQLLEATRKEFPALEKEINESYTDKGGFTDEDRKLELVTRALSQVFNKEYSAKPPASIRSLLKEFMQWFAQLVKDFGAFIGGKGKVVINVGDLQEGISLTDIARMLNTFDSQFLVDTTAPMINFRQATGWEATINTLISKANPIQKLVLKSLRRPANPVVLEPNDHVYLNRAGESHMSTTTAINGTLTGEEAKEMDRRYELNRLFGNDFDHILESLVLNRSFEEVVKKVKVIDRNIAEKAYRELSGYLHGWLHDGSILVPQITVSDHKSLKAGTIDLLMIHPDGTMTVIDLKSSKRSIKDEKYHNARHDVNEGSLLEGEALSKAQRHGIQIATYKRMLEVEGHNVVATRTFHIFLDIKGVNQNQEVIDYQIEGFEDHEPSAFESYVRKIIPTEPADDKLKKFRKKLGMADPVEGMEEEVDERTRQSRDYMDLMDKLTVKLEEFQEKSRKRIDRMERIKSVANFQVTRETKQKLSELLMWMSTDMNRGRADQAYGKFLLHAQEELAGLIDYLTDPAKKGTNEYIERVFDANTYLETYRGMVNTKKWAMGNYKQKQMFDKVMELLDDAQQEIRGSLEDYILRTLKANSSMRIDDKGQQSSVGRELTDEEWKNIIKEGVDISSGDLYLGDIDTSTDPLVAVAAKLYKRAKLKAMARSDRFTGQLYAMGNRLAKAFGKKIDYNMILDVDEDGKLTGRYIQKVGRQYWKKLKALKSKVYDPEGNMLQYRKVYDTVGAKAEDLAYNKQLYEAKTALREFMQAEVIDDKAPGGYKEGKYHKYKKEFIDERNKFEYFKDGRWIMKDDISWKEFKLYEHKYYQTVEGYDKPRMKDGVFTGSMIKGGRARIVKSEFVEVREVAEDGTNMVSEKWQKLYEGTDEKTKAMREFYEFYVQSMQEALSGLPLSVQRDMLGKIGRVRGKFIDRAKKSPSFFKAVTKSVTDWFTVRTSTRQSMFNEDDTLANQIPLFYTGGLRNDEWIADLEKKLEQLESDLAAKKVSKKDYMQQRKEIKEKLQIAEKSVAHNELETDLVKNLEKFYAMAMSFEEMQRIESSLLAVQNILENRTYKRLNAKGEMRRDKDGNIVEWEGKDSRALERFRAWMQMTFYNSDELDRDTAEVVMKRLMRISSTLNVGFNGFGAIHNYAMARINTAIESWGGLFYKKEAGKRAMIAFSKEFLPGYVRTMLSRNDPNYYKTKRMGSKYEALVKYFRMIRLQRLGEGRGKDDKSFIDSIAYGYSVQSAGEYAAQSKSGIAMLMSTTLRQRDSDGDLTGNELSIYDAIDFNEETGELTWKEGYEPSEDYRHDMTNKIWEMNKQIHGNYSWEDRAMIQRTVIGEMAMQFHKWVYPMYKARFQREYYDENLGYMQGRYRSVVSLIKYFKEAEGTFKERMYSAWHSMKPEQIRNLYRNIAEVTFFALCYAAYGIVTLLAEGVDDDDEYLQRLVNFTRFETSRQYKEILFWFPVVGATEQFQMVKNPFAAGTTLTQFADVLYQLAKLPIPPYDDAYYEKGPFRGDLKLAKEVRDIVPILKELNKWESFEQVTSFHIK